MILKALITLCIAALWGGLFALIYAPCAAPVFVLTLFLGVFMFGIVATPKERKDKMP